MKKWMFIFLAVWSLSVLFPVTARALDIVGTYDVKGTNPVDQKEYTGTLTIAQTGQTYKVLWDLSGTKYLGTGILLGDTLSVTYMDEQKSWFGVVIYKITADGKTLEGKWAAFMGDALGSETLTRK